MLDKPRLKPLERAVKEERKSVSPLSSDDSCPRLAKRSFDKRKPKDLKRQQVDEFNRNARIGGQLSDRSGSFDPREKIMGVIKQGQMKLRPSSNKIDRFGRIAFDKNKELSQASLDVKDEDEEEKKEEQ